MTHIQSRTELRSQTVISVLLMVTLTLNVQAQTIDTTPRTVTLKRGQVLELSLLTPLDSRQAEVGDQILFGLVHPLVADGVTVPAPWIIRGLVTHVGRPRKNCGGGVYWKLRSIEIPDGTNVKVEPISRDVATPHGNLLEQVVLDSSGNKNQRAVNTKTSKWAAVPLQIAAVPLFIAIAVGMQIEGDRGGCTSGTLPAGYRFYRAVSEDVQVVTH